MVSKYFKQNWHIGLLVVSILSVGLNIFLVTRKNFPIISSQGAPISEVVDWDQQAGSLGFAGAFLFNDKQNNLKDGYEYVGVTVKPSIYPPFKVECIFTEAMAYGSNVTISPQKKCELLAIDFQKKTASVKTDSTSFVINAKSVSWSDSRNQGFLATSIDRIFNY